MTGLVLRKMAEAMESAKKEHPAGILAKSMLGLGLGATSGYLAGRGLDALTKGQAITHGVASKALPLVGGALGMAYPYFHQGTVQKMQEAHQRR